MIVEAHYQKDCLPQRYVGNPLIEALPQIRPPGEATMELANLPQIDLGKSRALADYLRVYDIDTIDELYMPPPVAFELTPIVDQMIREGYVGRNPFHVPTQARLYQTAELLKLQKAHTDPLQGMLSLEGHSGMGKTRLVRTILRSFPQSIRHKLHEGKTFNQTQIVWLSVDAPIGGSIKGLLLRLLSELDAAVGQAGSPTSYETVHANSSIDKLIGVFAQAAATHFLGILHIDDLQRVTESNTGRKLVVQTMIQLANVLKCPVIFSGTPETMELLGETFEVARRTTKNGSFTLSRPLSSEDPFFARLFKEAMRYQWLDQPINPTPELRNQLYQMSAGITSVFLFLHKQAQKYALSKGDKELKFAHYTQVYRARLKPLRKALNELRKGGPNGAQQFEDFLVSMKEKKIDMFGEAN